MPAASRRRGTPRARSLAPVGPSAPAVAGPPQAGPVRCALPDIGDRDRPSASPGRPGLAAVSIRMRSLRLRTGDEI